LKANVMSSRVRTDVHAAAEPRGDDSKAAFARRTAGGKYRQQASVLLCETQFRDFFDHSWAPIETRLPKFGAISFFARADQNAGTFPGPERPGDRTPRTWTDKLVASLKQCARPFLA
jgi:hypothetical protein